MQSPRSRDFFVQRREDEFFILMSISDTLGHMKRPACVFLLVMAEGLVEGELIIILQLCSPRVSELICWYFTSQNGSLTELDDQLGFVVVLASLTSSARGGVVNTNFFHGTSSTCFN